MAYGLDDIDLAALKVSQCSLFPFIISVSCLNCRIAIDNHELIFWSLMRLLCAKSISCQVRFLRRGETTKDQ